MLKIANLLNRNEVQEYQALLAQADWQDGKLTAGHQAKQTKENLQLAEDSELARKLGDHIMLKLGQSNEFMSAALPAKIYPPMFNCYQGDGHFGKHIDNAIRKIPGAAVKLRSDLSATVFLSAPEGYAGGELLIDSGLSQQSIKLSAGDVLLYSASTVHEVLPVSQGHRYAAVFWVQSLVKSNHHRRILYDLDTSIQALTLESSTSKESSTRAESWLSKELLRLTGVYHNLLREWSEI